MTKKLTYQYDKKDRIDLLRHSKELEGHKVGDIYELELQGKRRDKYIEEFSEERMIGYVNEEGKEIKPKGIIGNLVQEVYFDIPRNSISDSDVIECGVELKVSSLKENKRNGNGKYSVKERLSLGNIEYNETLPENFVDSHIYKKCQYILLVYYIDYKKQGKTPFTFPFYKSCYFVVPKEDLIQIQKDYEYIRDCVNQNRLEDLHESKTKYLTSSTKGNKERKKKCFSYKPSYMNQIFREYIDKDILMYNPTSEKIVQDFKTEYQSLMTEEDYRNNKTIEEVIVERTKPFIGMTMFEIREYIQSSEQYEQWFRDREQKCSNNKNTDKSEYSRTTFLMLGIKSNSSEELVKSNILLKTIRIDKNKNLEEDVSFPSFEFEELMDESFENEEGLLLTNDEIEDTIWKQSQCYKEMVDREIIWSVFQLENNEYRFRGVKVWTLPQSDEPIIRHGWENIKYVIKKGVKFEVRTDKNGSKEVCNNFPNSFNTRPKNRNNFCFSDKPFNPILSIRPHTNKSYYDLKSIGYEDKRYSRSYGSELPNGDVMTKQCFWFRKGYIKEQISELLK